VARPAPVMRQKGTGPELRLAAELRALGAPVPKMSPQDVCESAPDLYFPHVMPDPVAVYVDGCSWHSCPEHSRPHRTSKNHGLTRERLAAQRFTDARNRAALRATGTKVISFWEHEIQRDARACARKVLEALKRV
jgi:DNA mismatch endonuclease, patch repair protein